MPVRKNLPHIDISASTQPASYTPITGFNENRVPLTARQQRFLHANKLTEDIDGAINERIQLIETLRIADNEVVPGICLDVEGSPNQPLNIDALENRVGQPIELLNVHLKDGSLSATIFVPERRLASLKKRVAKYGDETFDAGGTKASTISIDSIEAFKLADLDSFWMEDSPLPADKNQTYVWEAWLRKGAHDRLKNKADDLGIKVSAHSLNFQECEICLITCKLSTLAVLQVAAAPLMAFRYREEAPSFFTDMPPYNQAEWASSLAGQIQPAGRDAPAVCVLDTGVQNTHQLLSTSLSDGDRDSYDPGWGKDDSHGHGTEIAGLALLGDLTALLAMRDPVILEHRLESVKILPQSGANPEELYGWITQESISRAKVNAPQRKRVVCLAVTNPGKNTNGKPTAWSAAIDKLSAGIGADYSIEDENKTLFIVSVGNIRDNLSQAEYPDRNDLEPVENPAQAWNALSVGGNTSKTFSEDKAVDGWELLADHGEISPTSRTSVSWEQKDWPIKPDIVLEGGNCISDGQIVSHDADLSLLTTGIDSPLVFTCETSAATAQAARMAAIIQAEYPDYWPETIRGLLVHSARWTDSMFRGQTFNQLRGADKENLLRRFGYGVPDLAVAQKSASNRACLISQQYIQPFVRDEDASNASYMEMNIHSLPWPVEYLRQYGSLRVWLRVTLSYFIEPNPAERIPSQKYSYASHRLKFDLQRPLETPELFRQRINKKDRPQGEEFQAVDSTSKWQLGPTARNKGCVSSDVWVGTAAELSDQSAIAVMPEGGWWKYRKHLNRGNQKTRYSLVISLESEDQEIDIYTNIKNQISPLTEISS